MKKGAIEMEKIVLWALGVILALVIIIFIRLQLAPGSEGGIMHKVISAITEWR